MEAILLIFVLAVLLDVLVLWSVWALPEAYDDC